MTSEREHEGPDLPPAVSHRMELPSITDFIDQLMERIPETVVLNMADHRERNRLRSWMTAVLGEFLMHTEFAMQKGAERGVSQVATLIRDPDYYRTASERRSRRRSESKRQREESEARAAEARRQREEEAVVFKRMIEDGKVSLLNVRLNVSALPDEEKGPRDA